VSAVLALATVLQLAATPDCTALGMPPANVAAVARQESGFHPYAIRDETTDRSHYPATREDAEALAARLTAQGHLLGVGLMQLTPPANFGLSIAEAFDPCKNMKAGAELLAANYKLEWQALMRALSRYNSGSPTHAEAYAKRVVAQAQRNARMPSLARYPLSNLLGVPAPSSQRNAPPAAKPPCAPTWDVWAVCRQPAEPPRQQRPENTDTPAVEAAADAPVQCAASSSGGTDYVDHRPHPCGGRFVALLRVALA
jgi:type IV secretion system protein VirB1